MKYKKFREKNKDFKSRLEALLSICTPDPKGIALWSMGEEAYTQKELYNQVCNFCGLEAELFPLSVGGVWQYFVGNPSTGRKGSLEEVGAIVKEVKRVYNLSNKVLSKIVTAYKKTDVGRDFGDRIAAIATFVVNKLLSKDERPKFCSLVRILGYSQKPPIAKQRRMYAVYKILELLYKNFDSEFRWLDIVEETKLCERVVSDILYSLGKAGIIDYISPHREIGGKRRSYVKYEVKNFDLLEKTNEEIYSEIKKIMPYFTKKDYLSKILRLIKADPNKKYASTRIAKETGIGLPDVILCLSALHELGILQKEFSAEKRSVIKANENVRILWEYLFEPIGKVAINLDPYASPRFTDILELYGENEELRKNHLQNHLMVFSFERSHLGKKGGKELRRVILEVLGNRKMKLSEIIEKVNKRVSRKVHRETIRRQLVCLISMGKVKRIEKGFYKKL